MGKTASSGQGIWHLVAGRDVSPRLLPGRVVGTQRWVGAALVRQ